MASEKTSLKTSAQAMAEFAFALRYDDIPAEVITAARRHLADSLACAFGARETATVQALQKYAIAQGGSADATVIGTAKKVPASMAALVNGTMVRQLDANDIFVLRRGGTSGHFSDAAAALLALAEQYRRSGEELVTCLVALYELQGLLADSINFWDRGLHPVTNVAWVTPIVAARLIGADPVAAVHACGLAVATGTVMNTWIMPAARIPSIKGVAVGLALKRAIEAAELSAIGITATEDALETALARSAARPDTFFDPAPIENLGQHWSIKRNMLKRYPAQVNTQAAIEAVMRLYQSGIRAEHVRKLFLHGHRNVAGGVQGSAQAFAPANRESADHSTPYVMAMALLRGKLTLDEYAGAPWESPETKAVMAKIELAIDSEMDEAFKTRGMLGVRLITELNSGQTEEIVVGQPKGHPEAPLSDAELLEKMSWLMKPKASSVTPQQLFELCNLLSSSEDVQQLIASSRIDHP
jgi:2-methylcitrate dehydratase